MNDLWIDEYCLTKQGTIKEFKEDWNAIRYLIGGKMFALIGKDNTSRPILTLKLHPEEGDFFRIQYNDIFPGYYMNKVHWNSIYLDGGVPEGVIKDMIDKSYEIIFDSLTKELKKQIKNNKN